MFNLNNLELIFRFKYSSEDETKPVQVRIEKFATYNLYMNGGCYFEETAGENCDCEVLGKYLVHEDEENRGLIKDLNGKPAILEIRVGRGKALLSGVHFEFDAEKLELENENISKNVYSHLKSNERPTGPNGRILHSNRKLLKYLFKKVFSFE